MYRSDPNGVWLEGIGIYEQGWRQPVEEKIDHIENHIGKVRKAHKGGS